MADNDQNELPDRLSPGTFVIDYTVDLDGGGHIRLQIEADFLKHSRDEVKFITDVVDAVRDFEEERGIQLTPDGPGDEDPYSDRGDYGDGD